MEIKPMRISEAMRLGAMMKPQSFNGPGILVSYGNGKIGFNTSCALMAAVDGGGIPYNIGPRVSTELTDGRSGGTSIGIAVPDEWSSLLRKQATCPECLPEILVETTLMQIISHLNDVHHWSREAIADFVEINFEVPSEEPVEVQNYQEQSTR